MADRSTGQDDAIGAGVPSTQMLRWTGQNLEPDANAFLFLCRGVPVCAPNADSLGTTLNVLSQTNGSFGQTHGPAPTREPKYR